MANCGLLLNDGGSFVLLNDGTSAILLNDNSCDFEPGGEPTEEARVDGGGAIVAGWFSKGQWHNLKREWEEEKFRLETERLIQAKLEQEVKDTIESERTNFTRARYDELKASEQRLAAAKRRERELAELFAAQEAVRRKDEALAAIANEFDANVQANALRAQGAQAALAREILAEIAMHERLAFQQLAERELLRQTMENEEEDDMLALLALLDE